MIARLLQLCATVGPIGYLPASGTVASLLMIPIIYGLYITLSSFYYGILVLLALPISWYIIEQTCKTYDLHDDPSIVLDEVIGMLLVFWGTPWCTDIVIINFLLFRLFDITKIGGINVIETLPGAVGILGDDILAALYAKILVVIYIWLVY